MRRLFFTFPVLLFSFFWFSCAGSPGDVSPADAGEEAAENQIPRYDSPDEPFQTEFLPSAPPGMIFRPEGFPSGGIAPAVGLVTGDRRDRASSLGAEEKAALFESFRAAYIDALFRSDPLNGVLGGDFVHGWPYDEPSAWAQNWRSSAPLANSWGIPELTLAIRGIGEEAVPGRVFIVRGKVLDHYGKSAGINGANGTAGYGSARGHEFLHEGKIAQRFDFGLITIDWEGTGTFIPEAPPSLEAEAPAVLGVFSGDVSSAVREAFLTAWKMALDRGIKTMIPDGPGQYLSFTEGAWDFPGGEALKGLYIQSFDGNSVVLLLPDSPLLPPHPRLITSPFLDALLAPEGHSLPGGENLEALDIEFSGGDDFTRALMRGLALYGIPLGDPMPPEAEASPREVQRFSRGWLAAPEMRDTDF